MAGEEEDREGLVFYRHQMKYFREEYSSLSEAVCSTLVPDVLAPFLFISLSLSHTCKTMLETLLIHSATPHHSYS